MKRLNGWDAALLYSETSNIHMHTLKVAVIDTADFEGSYGFDLFRAAPARRLHLLEPLRYQLVTIPFKLHRPMWLENCEIDLDYHVRRVQVQAPGGRRELDKVVGEIASTPLDRSRPLWEFHFVEGMAHDRFAVVGKVHHALADGVASANLMARLMDSPDSVQDEPVVYEDCVPPSKAQLLRAAGRDHLQQVGELPRLIKHTAGGISRVRRRSRERDEHPELATNFDPPQTFINHVVSPGRRFATATLALSDIKETSKHIGVTINDLVLAMSAGALRELSLRCDGHADEPMIALVPASTDTSPDRLTGNELSGLLVSLPVHVPDPVERVRLTHVATGIAKENYHLLGPTLIGRWAAYFPPAVAPSAFRWMSRRDAKIKLFNISISNVPGPRERGRIAAATMSEIYSVGPLSAGSAINITVWSYVDQLNISVIADDQTLDDLHEATDAMVRSFTEIRCAAGLSGELNKVGTAMAQAGVVG